MVLIDMDFLYIVNYIFRLISNVQKSLLPDIIMQTLYPYQQKSVCQPDFNHALLKISTYRMLRISPYRVQKCFLLNPICSDKQKTSRNHTNGFILNTLAPGLPSLYRKYFLFPDMGMSHTGTKKAGHLFQCPDSFGCLLSYISAYSLHSWSLPQTSCTS